MNHALVETLVSNLTLINFAFYWLPAEMAESSQSNVVRRLFRNKNNLNMILITSTTAKFPLLAA